MLTFLQVLPSFQQVDEFNVTVATALLELKTTGTIQFTDLEVGDGHGHTDVFATLERFDTQHQKFSGQ